MHNAKARGIFHQFSKRKLEETGNNTTSNNNVFHAIQMNTKTEW